MRKAILLRSYVVFGLAFAFALLIMISSARLQMGYDKEFGELLKNKNTRIAELAAVRGNIYASGEKLLATTITKYTLIMDPLADGLNKELFDSKIDSLSYMLSITVGKRTAAQWKSHFIDLRNNKRRYAIITKDIEYGIVKHMRNWPIIRLGRYKGFYFEETGQRLYFMGDMARRALGYSRSGNYVGLEGAFDSLLRGVNGKQMQQRMPGGVWRTVKTANYNQPRNGYDIVTTLDVQIQDVAQAALNKAMVANDAERGCALVMEVKTGAIKAIANLSKGTDGNYYETRNYAIDDYSEPGSTIKLVSAMALINDGFAKPTDSININWGKYSFNGKNMIDASNPSKTILTLHECFQTSSNVGISKFVTNAYQNKPEKFIKYFKDLSLLQTPDFDIKSTGFPVVNTPNSSGWSENSLPWLSIGYEARLSPLQVLSVYNAVANNGKLMQPYIVSELRQEGRILKTISPNILNEQICKFSTLAALKSMMISVVNEGTATNIKNANYQIAGKTGTAQIADDNRGYRKGAYKSSFAGFLPADNPQFSIIVVINEPKKGVYYGGSVAGPVFKEIADFIFSQSNIKQNIPNQTSLQFPAVTLGKAEETKLLLDQFKVSSHFTSDSGQYAQVSKGNYGLKIQRQNPSTNKVPNVTNMGLKDAISLLQKCGLHVRYEGLGKVKKQSIAPGSKIIKGSTIIISLGK